MRSAKNLEIKPVAEIVGAATFSHEPEWFTTAPVGAIRLLLDKIGWIVGQVDLFEINEAFAVVTLFAEGELVIPPDKVNILGGAVALGHPIGCSGARILVTLLTALKHTGGRRGSPASASVAAKRSRSPSKSSLRFSKILTLRNVAIIICSFSYLPLRRDDSERRRQPVGCRRAVDCAFAGWHFLALIGTPRGPFSANPPSALFTMADCKSLLIQAFCRHGAPWLSDLIATN